jgi:hypothetical protein
MKRVIYYCDKCGKEIDRPLQLIVHGIQSNDNRTKEFQQMVDAHFCVDCLEEVIAFAFMHTPSGKPEDPSLSQADIDRINRLTDEIYGKRENSHKKSRKDTA